MEVKRENSVQLSSVAGNMKEILAIVQREGAAAIAEGDVVRYLVIDAQEAPLLDLTDAEKLDIVSKRIMEKHRGAFEELAK